MLQRVLFRVLASECCPPPNLVFDGHRREPRAVVLQHRTPHVRHAAEARVAVAHDGQVAGAATRVPPRVYHGLRRAGLALVTSLTTICCTGLTNHPI